MSKSKVFERGEAETLSCAAANMRSHMPRSMIAGLLLALGVGFVSSPAAADKLDSIVASGVLRCGVMLDTPPGGYRDSAGNPAGFNVDTCNDIAKELGVKATIVDTPGPQRIPALVSGSIDVLVASTTATLERGLSVLFTEPYNVTAPTIATRDDSNASSFAELDGLPVALVRGSTPETYYLAACKNFSQGCKNISLASNAEVITALRQGRAKAMIESGSFLLPFVASSQGKGLRICCQVPNKRDWMSIAVARGETGFRDWLNLFIFWRSETGRFNELYQKHYGAKAPSLKSAVME